jgi:hypothetical protein
VNTLDELRPRQREAVLLLWNGLSPKQVAASMRISPSTVWVYMTEVGSLLGGQCSPLQRIMLWQTELLRIDPRFLQLSASPVGPTLTVHGTPEPTPGDGMR